uniref:Uncharacterized protein n=1 Tax=Arundo donax TaxID=35708 RepID=A0A0A9BM88_ARUDO
MKIRFPPNTPSFGLKMKCQRNRGRAKLVVGSGEVDSEVGSMTNSERNEVE